MNPYFLHTFLIFLITQRVLSFSPCQTIEFTDYSFDLSSLSQKQIFKISGTTRYAQINYCTPTKCTDGTQLAYILRGSPTCQSYTINQTIVENYGYVNSNQHEEGIKISYLPFIKTTITENNGVTENNTVTSTATLQIRCNKDLVADSYCTQVLGTPVTTTVIESNITTSTITATNSISCYTYKEQGCPFLTLNNFWQFLMNHKIWFCVFLWLYSFCMLFMGYFIIRITIFLNGLMTGVAFGLVYTAENYENFAYDDDAYGISVMIVCLSFILGIFYGIFLLTLPKLGYVNIGFWVAIIFSLLMQNAVFFLTSTMLAFYITLGVSALIMSAIALLALRNFIILSTSFISAFWIIRTLGFFLPYYPNQFHSNRLFIISQSTPWQFYLYFISIIILMILGAVFQYCWYKKKGRDENGYYLEQEGTMVQKFKKLLEFQEIRDLISKGKDQLMIFKNIVKDESESEEENNRGKYKKMKQIKNSEQFQMKEINLSKIKKEPPKAPQFREDSQKQKSINDDWSDSYVSQVQKMSTKQVKNKKK